MARQPRIVIPGQAMHIVQRGNNRQATFYANEDYRKYLDMLFDYADQSECSIHAYVLMTNHIHVLLTPHTHKGVSVLMQSIGRKYVRYINRVYRRTGTLWEGRFKSAIVDSKQYFPTCSRYIELNPVRAGMVKGPGQYAWSSYRSNAMGVNKSENMTPHPLYEALGGTAAERRQAYRALFKRHIDTEALTLIRNNTQQCTIIGKNLFQEQVETMLQRRIMKQPHGGDRKSANFLNRVSNNRNP